MNTKPLKDWEYEELMKECARRVMDAISKGEPLLGVMYSLDNLTTGWRKEKGIKL